MLYKAQTSTNPDPNIPSLVYLRLPDSWQESHPLASSLQHFETALFLIALGRFPHALVSCVSAIESTIKAGLRIAPDSREDLVELLRVANGRFGPNSPFSSRQLDDMRKKRNRITHYGYSPKDDESTATLLLDTAFPFAIRCYSTFFRYSVIPPGELLLDLFPDVPSLLGATLNVWRRKPKAGRTNRSPVSFMEFVAQGVRWSTQHWSLSLPQRVILEKAAESWREFDEVSKSVEQLKVQLYDPMSCFDCPVCGNEECFVCEFDGGDCFDRGQLFAKRAICGHCGLSIDEAAGALTDMLISEQVKLKVGEICQGYGVKLN